MLHGDIRVTGNVIATWSARRLVRPPQERNDYEVQVTYQDPHGSVHTAKGVLSHKFSDGALLLTSEVMAWAHREVYHLMREG